jgi:hypothetical protein
MVSNPVVIPDTINTNVITLYGYFIEESVIVVTSVGTQDSIIEPAMTTVNVRGSIQRFSTAEVTFWTASIKLSPML